MTGLEPVRIPNIADEPMDTQQPTGTCEVSVSFSSEHGRLSISATVNAEGIETLKAVLEKCREILKLLQFERAK